MREARYTRTAIAFHWLMAVVLVGLFCLGTYMHELPLSPEKLRLYAWHKWAGISAFLLALSRLGWLLAHRPPAWPVSLPRWQEVLARGVHLLLYVLMLAIPLSGWLMSSAKGFPTIYLGVLPLPDLVQLTLRQISAGHRSGFSLWFRLWIWRSGCGKVMRWNTFGR
ncbi:cytochrome b [Accumulibacter sp.]|uniref:cytochrome b n=1 Tax=Accumulibacter sp. TaxID=2053492 RepID=UPI002609699F|nr:cytochrome b [Accumulibacter sp.]